MPLDNRTKELIAIAASIAASCQSCLEYHVGKAAEFGVDQQDIAQAVEVGRTVRQGAAAKIDQIAEGGLHQQSTAAGGGRSARWACGCGWGA